MWSKQSWAGLLAEPYSSSEISGFDLMWGSQHSLCLRIPQETLKTIHLPELYLWSLHVTWGEAHAWAVYEHAPGSLTFSQDCETPHQTVTSRSGIPLPGTEVSLVLKLYFSMETAQEEISILLGI